MRKARFEIYPGRTGEWYWRLVAPNGRIIADGSQGYASKSNCRRALNKVLAYLVWGSFEVTEREGKLEE
ncbi:MAG TPA: YegP family protein [Aridibacter sp.]|nr:YegP family protein [Aridibacter sp.]